LREHSRQELLFESVAAEGRDEMNRCIGDAHRAHEAELGLHEEILKGVLGDRRQRLRPTQDSAAM
jgi:hypothetical protein